jgi:signal transduction histidine kinase
MAQPGTGDAPRALSTAVLERELATTILDYLEGHSETALYRAYELGRRALQSGLGPIDLVVAQQQALLESLRRRDKPETILLRIEELQRCFLEALAAYEMAHRALEDVHVALQRIRDVFEGEILRIARTLRCETRHLMAGLLHAIDRLPGRGNGGAGGVRRVRSLLHKVEEQMLNPTHELRPTVLDQRGLLAAIESLRDGLVMRRGGLRVRVRGPCTRRFPPSIEVTAYRIVQEALSNVVLHARASKVWIQVAVTGNALVCSIHDNGVGFDHASPATSGGERGFGLLGMQERLQAVGGTLEIRTAPGRGTRVVATIPLAR